MLKYKQPFPCACLYPIPIAQSRKQLYRCLSEEVSTLHEQIQNRALHQKGACLIHLLGACLYFHAFCFSFSLIPALCGLEGAALPVCTYACTGRIEENVSVYEALYRTAAFGPPSKASSFTSGLDLFFSSMVITNDVALITFVPLTIVVFSLCNDQKPILMTVVLQTVAANVGSALTPVGNPQNLFLYSHYAIPLQTFLLTMAPLVIAGALFIGALLFLIPTRSKDCFLPRPGGPSLGYRESWCAISCSF